MRRAIWMRRIAGIGAIALACLVTPAAAEEGEAVEKNLYAERGVYLSLGARYQLALEKGRLGDDVEKRLGLAGASSSDVDDSIGFDGRLGYRLHPRLAIEGQFEWVNNFEIDTQSAFGKSTSEQRLFALTGNVKYFLLKGRIQPFLTAGAGWGRSTLELAGNGPNGRLRDVREDGLVTRWGAGVDLYGSRDVALSIDATYVLPTGPLEEMDYLSIGASLVLLFHGN